MALIKKAKPADAVAEPEDDIEATDEAPEEDAPLEDGPSIARADADADMMASLVPDQEPEQDAGGSDALLDMFTTVGIETVDKTVLKNLAGEVDMTDLISELGLVAAALGVVLSDREHADVEEELLAA